MTMNKEEIVKFCGRSQKEIRMSSSELVGKVICIGCGEDVTQNDTQCRCDRSDESNPKMMSLNDSMFQHLTGFPVM